MAVSPDGSVVAVASFDDLAINIYARDPQTGILSKLQVFEHADGGVDGLAGPRSLAFAPTQAHLYASIFYDDQLSFFAPNQGLGGFSLVEVYEPGSGDDGEETLWGSNLVAVSSDGLWVYATAALDDHALRFARDPETGALAPNPEEDTSLTYSESNVPTGLAISPNGPYRYYTTNEGGLQGSGVLRIVPHPAMPDSDKVLKIEEGYPGASIAGVDSGVYVSGTDWLLVAADYNTDCYHGCSQSVLASALVGELNASVLAGSSIHAPDGWGHQKCYASITKAVPISDDATIGAFATGCGWDLKTFSFEPATGEISLLQDYTIAGPEHLAFSPGGEHLYVITGHTDSMQSHLLTVLALDKSTGAMDELQQFQWLPNDTATEWLHWQIDLAITPDGKSLITATWDTGLLAVLKRDLASGELTLSEVVGPELYPVLDGFRAFDLSPDGKHLYTFQPKNGSISIWNVDSEMAALVPVDEFEASELASSAGSGDYATGTLVVAPSGEKVIVAGPDQTLVYFKRNGTTGLLTDKQIFSLDLGACCGLDSEARIRKVRQMCATRCWCISEIRAYILWCADGVHGGFAAGRSMRNTFLADPSPYRLRNLALSPDDRWLLLGGKGYVLTVPLCID